MQLFSEEESIPLPMVDENDEDGLLGDTAKLKITVGFIDVRGTTVCQLYIRMGYEEGEEEEEEEEEDENMPRSRNVILSPDEEEKHFRPRLMDWYYATSCSHMQVDDRLILRLRTTRCYYDDEDYMDEMEVYCSFHSYYATMSCNNNVLSRHWYEDGGRERMYLDTAVEVYRYLGLCVDDVQGWC